MAYDPTPDSVAGSVALVVGAATINLLPAAGVGFAYRIYAITVGITRTSGAAVADADLNGGGIFERITGLTLNGSAWQRIAYEFPGFQMPENAQLDVTVNSTVAAGSLLAVVKFYLDALA